MMGFKLILIMCFFILATDVNGFLFKKARLLGEDEAKELMLSGEGGTAIVDVGLGDMLIVMSGKMYTCRDLQIIGSAVKCPSGYDKFEFKNTKDMCFALRYAVNDDIGIRNYCLSPNYETVDFKIENGRYLCKSSSRSLNATIITEDIFYRVCRRRISDPIKVHFFAKDRDTMPAADNVECSHYTCEFMTYRRSNRSFPGAMIPMSGNLQPGPPIVPQSYPGYLPSGYIPNNRYPPVYHDQSAGGYHNDNAPVQMDTQGSLVLNQASDAVQDDADALKAAKQNNQ
nr:uncharacterized protein LOC111420952 [Onthophagus taurus]